MSKTALAVLALLALASHAWAGDSLGIGTNKRGVHDIAVGSQASPKTEPGAAVKVSVTAEYGSDEPGCNESASGSIFDLSCAAAVSIAATNTRNSRHQVVGLDVLAWSVSTALGLNTQPKGTGDVIGGAFRSVKSEGEVGTATAAFFAATLVGPNMDPSGTHPDNRMLGQEIRLENWTGHDCGHDPEHGIPGCMGVFVSTSGTPGNKRGTPFVAWDEDESLNSMVTCGGRSIHPDGACFEDYSRSYRSVVIAGEHVHGVDMLNARIKDSAVRLPSWAPVVWGESRTVGVMGDEAKGELWLGGVPILHSLADGKSRGRVQLCLDLETRRVEIC